MAQRHPARGESARRRPKQKDWREYDLGGFRAKDDSAGGAERNTGRDQYHGGYEAGGYPEGQGGPYHGGSGYEHSASHDFDQDYLRWRDEQVRKFDDDYRTWKQERYGKFSQEFDEWRRNRKK